MAVHEPSRSIVLTPPIGHPYVYTEPPVYPFWDGHNYRLEYWMACERCGQTHWQTIDETCMNIREAQGD